jgi:hypothetical protein
VFKGSLNQGGLMGTVTIHEGVRRMRLVSLMDRQERGEFTQEEAAEILGKSVRTFQRWLERYAQEGEAGLGDRRIGKPSPKRAPATASRYLGAAMALRVEAIRSDQAVLFLPPPRPGLVPVCPHRPAR